MARKPDQNLVPATTAAVALRLSRETVIRRLQRGELRGENRDGFWFVRRAELDVEASK